MMALAAALILDIVGSTCDRSFSMSRSHTHTHSGDSRRQILCNSPCEADG